MNPCSTPRLLPPARERALPRSRLPDANAPTAHSTATPVVAR